MAFEALNEKLKNIGKKNPDIEKNGSNGISAFFKKNTFMKYVIPVMIFLVIVAVFLALVFSGDEMDPIDNTNPSSISGASDESVAVLPDGSNIVGSTDKSLSDLIKNDPLSPDILVDAEYHGCVIGAGSSRHGIIENGGISYTLAIGETLGGSSWEVTEITTETITLSAGKLTKTLTLA